MNNSILLFLLFSFSVYSQDCKYERNEIDAFTKSNVLETKQELLSRTSGFDSFLIGRKVNNSRFISLRFATLNIFSIAKGSKFQLLTDKDEVIEIPFEEYKISKPKLNSGTITTWHSTHTLALTNDLYEKIISSNIVKLRLNTTEGYIDSEITQKRWRKCVLVLKCIQ